MDRRLLQGLEPAAADHVARAPRLALLACLLATATAAAQASHTSRPYLATFTTSGQSMWGSGSAPLNGFDRNLSFADVSWDVSGNTPGVGEWFGFDFGADIGGASRGAFGVFARFNNVGTGAVNVTYPVEVTLGIPDANTFRDGQTITIPSAVRLLAGAAIATLPPRADIDFRAKAKLAASAQARLCFFDCVNIPLFPSVDIGSDDIPLFSMSVNPAGEDFVSLGGRTLTLPHTLDFIESQVTNMSGTIGLPKVHPISAVGTDGMSLMAVGRDTFVDLSLDLDGFFTGKIPLGFQSPEIHGVSVGYETVDFSGVLKLWQDQAFTFVPRIFAVLEFPRAVAYTEVDAGGATVHSGTNTSIRFRVGNTLNLVYPTGLKDPMTIAPTFAIENTFTSATSTTSREDLVLTVGKFNLHVPRVTVIPEFTVDVCWGLTHDADPLGLIPDESCAVTSPAQEFPGVNVDLGPLYQKSLAGTSQNLSLFPFAPADCTPGAAGCGTWELAGFNTAAGESFVLDPENPILRVTTTLASALATGTGPAGSLTQAITVTNAGDVPLSTAQIADALSAAVAGGGGFGVRSVASPTLTKNAGFNGLVDRNTLTRADVLAVGGSGTLAINIAVLPGNVFSTLLDADGTTPIGTNVRAAAAASFGVFAFDIRPSSQNSASNGVLPVVVLGTTGMDPARIDPATLRLEGVAPLRWEVVPRGAVNDLTIKFDRQAILAALQRRLASPVAVAALAAAAAPNVAPDPALVARAVLGDAAALTPEQVRAIDRNGNGVADIGDLRALLRGGGGSGGPAEPIEVLVAGAAAAAARGPSGTSLVLVLTGQLRDGTPFMGENSLVITNNGSAQ